MSSGGPSEPGTLWIARTNATATMTPYRSAVLGADHQWKTGLQLERGEHESMRLIPTGKRFVDLRGEPFQVISRDPSSAAGLFLAAGLFASDAITIADSVTINAGLRFDYGRAISPDVAGVDRDGQADGTTTHGLGFLYDWKIRPLE